MMQFEAVIVPTDSDGEVAVRLDKMADGGSAILLQSYDNDSGETINSYLPPKDARRVAAALIAAADRAEGKS